MLSKCCIALCREAVEGPVSLGGYEFKQGTLFWVPLFALHNYKGESESRTHRRQPCVSVAM